MSTPACPTHGAGEFIKPSKFGVPGTHFCAFQVGGFNATTGKPNICGKKIEPSQDAVAAPVAPNGAGVVPDRPQASPRLLAASTALRAAAAFHSGTAARPELVMNTAAIFYHNFLVPSFKGEVPTEFPDPDVNF